MKFKIISNVNQKEWNEYLQLSDYSTFFQTAEFLLKKNSERYPLFIYIYNDSDEKHCKTEGKTNKTNPKPILTL